MKPFSGFITIIILLSPNVWAQQNPQNQDVDAVEVRRMQDQVGSALQSVQALANSFASSPSATDLSQVPQHLMNAASKLLNRGNPDAATPSTSAVFPQGTTGNANPQPAKGLFGALAQVDVHNLTPSAGMKMIESLLAMLPDDSTIKPLIRSLMQTLTNYNQNLEKASNPE